MRLMSLARDAIQPQQPQRLHHHFSTLLSRQHLTSPHLTTSHHRTISTSIPRQHGFTHPWKVLNPFHVAEPGPNQFWPETSPIRRSPSLETSYQGVNGFNHHYHHHHHYEQRILDGLVSLDANCLISQGTPFAKQSQVSSATTTYY